MSRTDRLPAALGLPLEIVASVAASVAASLTEELRKGPRGALRLPLRAVSTGVAIGTRIRQDLTANISSLRTRWEEPDEQDRFESAFDRVTEDTRDLLDVRPAPPPTPPPTPASQPASLPTEEPAAAHPATVPPAAQPPLAHDELPLPDFDHMTLGQLRGRLRRLDVPSLIQLREYERAHGQRVPILTMLGNRISKLEQADDHSGAPQPARPGAVPPATRGGSKVSPATSGPSMNPPSQGVPTNPRQPR